MADKIYVEIGKFSVGSVKETQHKSSLPSLMEKTARAAVGKSSALTSTKPTSGKGYKLSGTLTKLEVDAKAKELRGGCKLVITILPEDKVKAMPDGSAPLAIDNPAKISKADVEFLVEAIIRDTVTKQAVVFMAKNPPP